MTYKRDAGIEYGAKDQLQPKWNGVICTITGNASVLHEHVASWDSHSCEDSITVIDSVVSDLVSGLISMWYVFLLG